MGGALDSAGDQGIRPAVARAGFVLTGGLSTRMGRDKALLPVDGSVLVERIAGRVRAAAGNVALIGGAKRYRHLGFPVHDDLIEDCGPIGGVLTALTVSNADWNLVVACDMPGVTVEFLTALFEAADSRSDCDCVVADSQTGTVHRLHPLCAVYHRRCRAAVEQAVARKSLKMHDLLDILRTLRWPVPDPLLVENVNTPLEWSAR